MDVVGSSTCTTSTNPCDSDTSSPSMDVSNIFSTTTSSSSTSPEDGVPDNSSPMSRLLAARAASLRRCTTVVTRPDGRCYQETRSDQGFTALTSSGQGHGPDGQEDYREARLTSGQRSAPEEVVGVHPNHKERDQSLGATTQGQLASMLQGDSYADQGGPYGIVPSTISHGGRNPRAPGVDERKEGSSDVFFNRKCPGFVIDMKPDLRCSVILPYLLLGSQDVANELSILYQFKITHVLSLVPPSLFNSEPQHFLQIDGTVVTTQPSSDAGVPTSECVPLNSSLLLNQRVLDNAAKFQERTEVAADLSANIDEPSTTQNLPPEVIYAPMLDIPEHQILDSFPACHRFLVGVKRAGGVALVHCNAGVSRAPTVVIAYLMTQYKKSYEEALRMVREKRPFIRPNAGFVEQLKRYECLLKE